MGIFAWIGIGCIAGLIASLIMGPRVVAAWLARICLGIAGAVVGGWAASRAWGSDPAEISNMSLSGLIGAAVGAVLLIAFHRLRRPRKRKEEVRNFDDYHKAA